MRRLPLWRGVVSLVYHRIGDPSQSVYDRTGWEATIEAFDAQLGFLKREFEVISPEDLPEVVAARRPRRHLLITFDDAYRNTYEDGYPLLRKHGLPATFFVTTGFLDSRSTAWWDEIAWMVRTSRRAEVALPGLLPAPLPIVPGTRGRAVSTLTGLYKHLPGDQYESFLAHLADELGTGRHAPGDGDPWMTWDDVREMRRNGMTIGGHTVTHPILARLDEHDQRQEIFGCKARLEEELDEPMRYFSYPVGGADCFDERTRGILTEAGVELAFSFYGGYRSYRRWDPFDVQRRSVAQVASMPYFRMALTLPGLFPNR